MALKWLGAVVTPAGIVPEGAVVFDGDTLLWVGDASEVPSPWAGLEDSAPAGTAYLLPGLVDIHCHGGGGASFPDAEAIEDVRTAAAEHLGNGTTTLVASLVTAPLDTLEQQARLLAEAVAQGIVRGIHFEGPFLSAARCGAQDPRYLIDPTASGMARLLEASGGKALSMTVAPERAVLAPEGPAAMRALADSGAIPSWGHTDASADITAQAIELGESLGASARITVTHMFNGMPPLHHRSPGPIGRFLAAARAGRLVLELICDGVHIDPSLVGDVVRTVGRDNCVFVTDSMAAAGMPDGDYRLGPQAVRIEDGIARLAEGGALAGGTSHLLDCVRVAVTQAALPLDDAVFLAATQGARIFGWDDRGELTAGRRADLLALDGDLALLGVLRGGESV